MQNLPSLTHFRVERHDHRLVHLVFDCPGRSMNVFTNQAIHELGTFAEWLHQAAVRGVIIRSGKASGFCAGADLTELGAAYDMIVDAPLADRFDLAFDHFFPLSHAIRRLETAGKPVAAAVNGLALGGGCELVMGCHYRAATNTPQTIFGLPECAVGLLPGGGGTQRMPRLVGVPLGLEVLLQGRTLQGLGAVDAGLVDELVDDGAEVAAAEAWLMSDTAQCVQPWDRNVPGTKDVQVTDAVEYHRVRELARTLGHEPAPFAILDCIATGTRQPIDCAIRTEMGIFAGLIQRPEPRNMIRTMFLGKQAWGKAERDGSLSIGTLEAIRAIKEQVDAALVECPDLAFAGIGDLQVAPPTPKWSANHGYWLIGQAAVLAAAKRLAHEVESVIDPLPDNERLQLDYAVCRNNVLPAYLGGATGFVRAVQDAALSDNPDR